MRALYTFGVYCYGLAIRLASLFNPKAKKWIRGRKGIFDTLPNVKNKEVVWFHCASLGEFDQGLPLMNLIKTENPDTFLIITFFSPSGFEHYEKRDHLTDFACYLPLDTPSNARKFVSIIQPKSTYFVKYEFWANYIVEAKKAGSSIYNVSGLFRNSHRFFKWYGGFFRSVLGKFDFFFVQNETSKDLLERISIKNVEVTGDSRFDRVIENSKKADSNKIIEEFKGDQSIIVIGSSWPVDEEILAAWMNKSSDKILIAPHQVDEKHIQQIQKALTRKVARYSQTTSDSVFDFDILILDTIGMLASAYKYGEIAYVGGGFSGSLHNILEPAVFGLPVIFGPKHKRFPEAQAFIDHGFGFSINTLIEFENSLSSIKSNLSEISQEEKLFIEKNSGASKRIYHHIISS